MVRLGKGIMEEAGTFFAALSFLTRLPSPGWAAWREERFRRCSAYFPLVGWVVGGTSAAVFWTASLALPQAIAVLLAMGASLWLTGGFHEDGWADFCDGFGGGWSKERILSIMKDPRLGGYGAMGLWLLLTGRLLALAELPSRAVPVLLVAGHALSRAFACLYLFTHAYARDDADSPKAKPATGKPSLRAMAFIGVTGALPCLLPALLGLPQAVAGFGILLAGLAALHLFLGRLFVKGIGGYTGDCLGAAQQLSELFFYLWALAWIGTFS